LGAFSCGAQLGADGGELLKLMGAMRAEHLRSFA